jgi:hypothetical protein
MKDVQRSLARNTPDGKVPGKELGALSRVIGGKGKGGAGTKLLFS